MLTEIFRRYGQAAPPIPLISLRAGPLAMEFDETTGFVRWIRDDDHQVLRGMYVAVRDHNWDTVPPMLRFSLRDIREDSFELRFECEHRRGAIDFRWSGVMTGSSDGTLSYVMDGVARTAFRKNRVGFCVLYPIAECAGQPARQMRTDGTSVESRFPDLIEPQVFGQSSFRQLRGVQHPIGRDGEAQVEFEGDVFEMEDQRNWTDASFKIYCTPLLEPFPVTVEAGQRIRQKVTLRVRASGVARVPSPSVGRSRAEDGVTMTVPDVPTGLLPRLGLGVATDGPSLSATEVERLRELKLAHLRVDVRLGSPESAALWERAVSESKQLGVPLELAVHLPRTELTDPYALLPRIREHVARIARVLALREREGATSPETLAWVRRQFSGTSAPIGAGSDCNFRELNHAHVLGRLGLDEADFVSWSVNPQVHAFDHHSIMETLDAQPATARTARSWAGR